MNLCKFFFFSILGGKKGEVNGSKHMVTDCMSLNWRLRKISWIMRTGMDVFKKDCQFVKNAQTHMCMHVHTHIHTFCSGVILTDIGVAEVISQQPWLPLLLN